MTLSDTPLFHLIFENTLGRTQNIQSRAYTCLFREWVRRNGYRSGYPTIEFMTSMSADEMIAMQGAGIKIVSYLIDLKELQHHFEEEKQ